MKTKSITSLIIILSVGVIALCGVCYFVYGQVSTRGQQLFDLTEQSNQNNQKNQEIKRVMSSLITITPQIKKIDGYFIASDGEVNFINEIEDIAKANNLIIEISSVSLDTTSDLTAKGFEYLTLKLSTKGSWAGTYKFLSLLSNMPYKVNVKQADVSNVSDTGAVKVSLWQGSFTVQVLKKSATDQIKK
jgi:hypothetical protein